MKIGFHLPIAKGFAWTLREARRLQCEVAQIFLKNPRSWAEKIIKERDIDEFTRLAAEIPVYAHLSYLPNLAKAPVEPRNRQAFLHEASLAAQLGIRSLIVHCGSHENKADGMRAAAQSIQECLEIYPLRIYLENAAGQGRGVGKNLSELAFIHENVALRDKVGLCLDTAHLFEAGYDVRSIAIWEAIIAEVEERFGPDKISFFHLNDSKTPLGSTVDRHWHIGKGQIGLDTFRFLVREKRFAHLGGVMETPKAGNMDEKNMKTMRSLRPAPRKRSAHLEGDPPKMGSTD
jgi:deoxyribonuclease IV